MIYRRRQGLYKGLNPRRYVQGNVNYLDHNILSLSNRVQAYTVNKTKESLYNFNQREPRGKSVFDVKE